MAYRFNPFNGALELYTPPSTVGDITAVGNVASGQAFNGTQGTTLTFFNAGGNNTISYDGTNIITSTSFTSDTDNTDNLGTSSVGWASLFLSDAGAAPTTNGEISYNASNNRFEFYQNGGVVALGGGANTLDGAYDQGGAGSGRTINVDSGAVLLTSTETTNNAFEVSDATSLTSGGLGYFYSNSASTTGRNLVNIINDNTLATGVNALRIQQDSTSAASIRLAATTSNISASGNIAFQPTGSVLFKDADGTTNLVGINQSDNAIYMYPQINQTTSIFWGSAGEFRQFARDDEDVHVFQNNYQVSASGVGYGLYQFNSDRSNTGMTADQVLFQVGKGATRFGQVNYTSLFTIDEDGDVVAAGTITGGSSITIDGTTNPGTITESNGAISFGDENLTTTGIVRATRYEIDAATTYIDVDGSNNMTFTDAVSGTQTLAALIGGATSPGGADTNIQYNNGGAFGGESNFTYDDTNKSIILTTAATTTNAAYIDADTVTTGLGLQVTGDALTTGRVARFYSNSADASSRGLIFIHNDNTLATGALLLSMTQDAAGTSGVFSMTINADNHGFVLGACSTATREVFSIFNCNSLTTGKIIHAHSNSADTSTRELVTIHNDNTLATGAVPLEVIQDSTGGAISVTSASTTGETVNIIASSLTSGSGIRLYSNSASTTGRFLHFIHNDNPLATGANPIRITQDSTGACISVLANGAAQVLSADTAIATSDAIVVTGNSLTTGGIAQFYSNSADTSTRDLLFVHNDNVAATGAICLTLQNDAGGDAIKIVDGNEASGRVLTSDANGVGTWQAAASGAEAVTKDITQATHGFAVGDVVYYTGSAYAKAQADTEAKAEVVGIVDAVAGVNDFTLNVSGYIDGLAGLTAGTVYYLSAATAGALTSTEPTISKPVLIAVSTTAGYFVNMRGLTGGGNVGKVLQVVNTQTGAVSSGSTAIPDDDTIPQNTEGDEYMTLAITPTDSNSKLKIEVVGNFALDTAAVRYAVALFQDSTANALAAMSREQRGGNANDVMSFTHYMTAGTTSSTTFKVRAGGASGTLTFNGAATARKLGGVMASSITITEISS